MAIGPKKQLRARIVERDGDVCHWCGRRTDPTDYTVVGHGPNGQELHAPGRDYPTADHVVPLLRRSPRQAMGDLLRGDDNVVLACRACNTARGAMSSEEFRASEWLAARRLAP